MSTVIITGLVCLLAATIIAVSTLVRKGYRRVKAGFTVGRSGFYIESLARSRSAAFRRYPIQHLATSRSSLPD